MGVGLSYADTYQVSCTCLEPRPSTQFFFLNVRGRPGFEVIMYIRLVQNDGLYREVAAK